MIAPKLNEADLDEFPPSLKDHMEFVWVEQIDEVLARRSRWTAPSDARSGVARAPRRTRSGAARRV